VERLNIFDDVVLWLSMLSIAAICLVLLYNGITGLAHVPSTDISIQKKAFSVSVFALFILLPLLIVDLVLGTTFISNFVEWSTPLLYVAIIADIILMTVLFLIM
jgi:cytochrome bd-type quinol oxidase subunit 2